MARVTTEDCITSLPNRFQLVIYACNRARDLASGTEAGVSNDNDKNTVIALREIAEKKIDLRYYSIIYNLIDDVKAGMSGLLTPETKEDKFGSLPGY